MVSDETPVPEPSGSLVPPPRNPPTALAVSTPPPPRRPRSIHERLQAVDPRTKQFVDDAIDFVFDRADALGDGIARVLGLRPKSATPPARSDAVD